jgi:hypothetical protein
MGLLDDLIRSLEEAADPQQRRPPVPTGGRGEHPPRPGSLPPHQQTRTERRQAQQSLALVQADAGESVTRRTVADSAPATVVDLGESPDHPLVAKLRSPAGLRDAFILTEILRRPNFRR